MRWFRRTPKHVHTWGRWVIAEATDYRGNDVAAQIRTCQTCGYTDLARITG